VKETTNATNKLPKFDLPSRRSSSKKRNGLSPAIDTKTKLAIAGALPTLPALTLAAVYN
jgi:hypothetical protein